MKQKKARVEDALHATRAAVEEGILPGGGVALLRCQRSGRKRPLAAPRATRRSASTSCSACSTPRSSRSPTTAASTGSVVADEVSQKATNIGYDANAGEYVDMVKAGILDPHEGREDGAGERRQHRRPDAHDRSPGHELRLQETTTRRRVVGSIR